MSLDLPRPDARSIVELATTFDVGLNKSHADLMWSWRSHAVACFPEEAAGAFTTDFRFVPLANRSFNPEYEVAFDPREVLAAGELAGIVHSHTRADPGVSDAKAPKAVPSKTDMENQVLSAVPWGISTVENGECSLPVWFGDQLPIRPWLGRTFMHGISDCCSIIRDYHRCHGVHLPEVPRDDAWWLRQDGGDLYMDHFEPFGFRRVEGRAPREHDMFICSVRSDRRNHAGMIVGRGTKLLHHIGMAGMLSAVSPAERWQSKLNFLVRHRDFGE